MATIQSLCRILSQNSLNEERKLKQEKQDDFKRAAREVVSLKEIQKKEIYASRERDKEEHNKLFEDNAKIQVAKQRQYREV